MENESKEGTLEAVQQADQALAAAQRGDFAAAAAGFARAAALQPSNAELQHNLGFALARLSRLQEAEHAYRRALALKPAYPEAYSNLGNALKQAGRLQEALACYGQAIALAPRYAEAHNNLGTALQELGQMQAAERSYRQALELAPGYAEAHNNLGTVLQRAGRLEDAERSYRSALSLKPDFALAYNNLGTVLRDVGRLAEAEQSYGAALARSPGFAEAHYNVAGVQLQLGKLEQAAASYREALRLLPGLARAHNDLGSLLLRLRRVEDAERSVRAALELNPNFAEAHNNLGVVEAELGRYEEAERSYLRSLELRPRNVETLCNLANTLKGLKRLDDAERRCREALAVDARFAHAHNTLGTVLADAGRVEEARQAYSQAIALNPAYPGALNNLGIALQRLGRSAEAQQSYRRALEVEPDFALAHNNLGTLLEYHGQVEEAERSYRRSLELNPAFAEAHYNLGNVLKLQRQEEAEVSCRRAIELDPGFVEARALWFHLRQHLCIWEDQARDAELLRRAIGDERLPATLPFVTLCVPGSTPAEQYACARKFAEKKHGELLAQPPLAGGSRSKRKKLRLGYLSADFNQHATAALMTEIVELHDRARFEVYGYSYGRHDDSDTTKRIRGAFDVLRELREVPEEAAARRIRDDEVDILVELKGYTNHARIAIAAFRPAPVQVNWLGYPGTLGHPRLADWLIGDPVVTPLEHAANYSESLALMPHCYQPNDRKRKVGKKPTRAAAGLPCSGFVFCSLNQSYKITPSMFDVWCRLIAAVPRSVLWLLLPNPTAQANLLREAAARGIDSGRIVFAPKVGPEEHLARLQLADLALDTYPVNSHTTASDALWAGVPLVTLIGPSFISRVAASILHAAGLKELVTESVEDYYRVALELAAKPARLKRIRASLEENRLKCALFDSKRFTRDLETLYLRMWKNSLKQGRDHILL